MAPRSAHVEATIAATLCTIKKWHPTKECEHSEEEEAQRFRTLSSDLSMIRNYSTSPFFRLPPELRIRIYGFVLGG